MFAARGLSALRVSPRFAREASSATAIASGLESSTLKNGLRVVSQDAHGHVVSVGLSVGGGSSAESGNDERGAAYALQNLAFQPGTNFTSFGLISGLEGLGASLSVRADRDQIFYQLDVVRHNLRPALQLLNEAVSNGKYSDWFLENTKHTLTDRAREISSDSRAQALQDMHIAAYGTSSLGKGLLPQAYQINRLSADDIKNYVERNYVAGNMAVAAVGVDAETLKGDLEDVFTPAQGGAVAPAQAAYVGGVSAREAAGPTSFAIGLTTSGDATLDTVVRGLLDGASSNAAENQHITTQGAFLAAPTKTQLGVGQAGNGSQGSLVREGLAAGTLSFGYRGGAGLVAVVGQGSADDFMKAATAVKAISNASDEEIALAVASAKGAALRARESRQAKAGQLSHALFAGQAVKSDDELLSSFDNVAADKVRSAASSMLKQGASVAVVGDLTNVDLAGVKSVLN